MSSTATTARERPILFSAPMIRAILAGQKSMTRRIVKPQPPAVGVVTKLAGDEYKLHYDAGFGKAVVYGPVWAVRQEMNREPAWPCRFGKVGDRLWVRETWTDRPIIGDKRVHYKADGIGTATKLFVWKSPIHMPRRLSRILLEVTGIRVERLHEISEDDAIAEGMDGRYMHRRGGDFLQGSKQGTTPVEQFSGLWKSINGPESWARNDFVWVVSFRRINA